MASIEKIKEYLSGNPYAKAKDIARYLGSTRKAVNSILYYNEDIFCKDAANRWGLEPYTESPSGQPVRKAPPVCLQPENTVLVDNLDLVERIKDLLKQHNCLKLRDLAEYLDEPRSLITRTLHSYQAVFERNSQNEWYIRSDYLDNTTGPDASFANIDSSEDIASQLPVADFKEEGKAPQQTVIEATLDRNFLVLAPPGTGKTHTLIERLVYAIDKSDRKVDAGELLVLSFTRAAVGEIRDRIAKAIADGAPSSLRYVQIKTFDSYASRLLDDGGYDISGKSYDARIELLTKELGELKLRQSTARIDRSRYLFVDEIQDLVGIRADMVFELVKRMLAAKGSVTLLGDPHQSLNDYQVSGYQTDSDEFLQKVKKHLDGGLESFELDKTRRYETSEMRDLAANAKKILDSKVLTVAEKYKNLVDAIPDISVDEFRERVDKGLVSAVLCRTNKEVFRWVNWLEENGYSCSVNHGSQAQPWPAWIGALLIGYQSDVISLEILKDRLKNLLFDTLNVTEKEIEDFLVREKLVHRNIINLHDLSFRLMNFSPATKVKGDIPDMVMSTIHKAKGLEYPDVIIAEPYTRKIEEADLRVLYVAITRAKQRIALVRQEDVPFNSRLKPLKRSRLKPKRCQYRQGNNKFFQLTGLDDFDTQNLFILPSGDFDETGLRFYLENHQRVSCYSVEPEYCHNDSEHDYALYLNFNNHKVRLCPAGQDLKNCLDSMSYGNKFGRDGVRLDIGGDCNYQTIVHPMKSPVLTRYAGPAGIMTFPLIQGFYPLSRAAEK